MIRSHIFFHGHRDKLVKRYECVYHNSNATSSNYGFRNGVFEARDVRLCK